MFFDQELIPSCYSSVISVVVIVLVLVGRPLQKAKLNSRYFRDPF